VCSAELAAGELQPPANHKLALESKGSGTAAAGPKWLF